MEEGLKLFYMTSKAENGQVAERIIETQYKEKKTS